MAKPQPVGHMTCPECDFPDAEIKHDKNGNPYRYCPDCSAQYMTHGRPHKVANLQAKMRPIAAAIAEAFPAPVSPLADTPPETKPAKRRFLI
jgi:hypothetical protein